MSQRDDFLGRLRGGTTSRPAAAPLTPRAQFVNVRRGPEGFLEAWQALGGTAERVPLEGLSAAVANYASRHEGPVLATAGLEVDADLYWPDCGSAAVVSAGVGVVRATAAVAQTGTVLLRSDESRGRAASLLPPSCIFVIDSASVVDTLGDFLRNLQDLPSQLVAVTGPSRSADIESTLVIGVHGPGEVHAIVTK